ncbi:MAG TPA: hypothetical protein VKC34_11605, partial [Blastocatellia bacterium]|nr:hypothetical protein [Blastocatellia bacterium]
PSVIQEPKGQERYLCAACARKRLAGRLSESSRSKRQYPKALLRLRNAIDWPAIREGNWMDEIHDWIGDFEKFLDAENRDDYWRDAERRYEKNGPRDKNVAPSARKWVTPAQDLAELADRNGFVGLIYADGNNVGSIIEQIETAIEYRQFAERMFEANQMAVFKAVAGVLRPHKTIPNDERPKVFKKALADDEGRIMVHPFEILSIGGDDFMLFVPGDKALEIAKRIGSNLEERFASRWLYETREKTKDLTRAQRYRPGEYDGTKQARVSLSAGVIIADCHTPVYLLEDMAEQLLKSAKQRAKSLKKDHGYHGGTIDFMVLKSVPNIISEVQTFRDQVLQSHEIDLSDNLKRSETLRLYARPYTLHELHGLLQLAREFQEIGFPRSQLYDIRNDTLNKESGRTISTLNYLYFCARTQNRYAKAIRKHFEEDWWGKPAEWLHPWRVVSDKLPEKIYETILYDLVEIYDFAERGGEKDNGDQAKLAVE